MVNHPNRAAKVLSVDEAGQDTFAAIAQVARKTLHQKSSSIPASQDPEVMGFVLGVMIDGWMVDISYPAAYVPYASLRTFGKFALQHPDYQDYIKANGSAIYPNEADDGAMVLLYEVFGGYPRDGSTAARRQAAARRILSDAAKEERKNESDFERKHGQTPDPRLIAARAALRREIGAA